MDNICYHKSNTLKLLLMVVYLETKIMNNVYLYTTANIIISIGY